MNTTTSNLTVGVLWMTAAVMTVITIRERRRLSDLADAIAWALKAERDSTNRC